MSQTTWQFVTPKPHLLAMFRNDPIPPAFVSGEFIDNAFDAGATRLSIEVTPRYWRFADNGEGFSDLSIFARLGDSPSASKKGKLGRYGIGAKHAAIQIGDRVHIVSSHLGHRYELEFDFQKLQRMNDWKIAATSTTEATSTDKPGTTITVYRSRHAPMKSLKGPGKQAFINALSWIYHPALSNGKTITFASKHQMIELTPTPIPDMREFRETTLQIDGRSVHVCAGIVPDDTTFGHRYFTIAHHFRMIRDDVKIALGNECPASIFGIIRLGEGWHLSKNKNTLSDRDYETLDTSAELREFAKPLIQLARAEQKRIKFDFMREEMNRILNGIAVTDVERRTREQKKRRTQETEPQERRETHKTRRKRRPKNKQKGKRRTERSAIQWDAKYLGACRGAWIVSDDTIVLNSSIGFIEQMVKKQDLPTLVATSIAAFCSQPDAADRLGAAIYERDQVEWLSKVVGFAMGHLDLGPG